MLISLIICIHNVEKGHRCIVRNIESHCYFVILKKWLMEFGVTGLNGLHVRLTSALMKTLPETGHVIILLHSTVVLTV